MTFIETLKKVQIAILGEKSQKIIGKNTGNQNPELIFFNKLLQVFSLF